MAEENTGYPSSVPSYEDLVAAGDAYAKQKNISDLALRASLGSNEALAEAKQQDAGSTLPGLRDIASPFVAGVASGVGSLAHLAASGLNAAGISSDTDPSSLASKLDSVGESINKFGQDSEKWASTEKQVRDQANQMQVQGLSDSGDYLGAALAAAKYKASHPLETTSELAGGIAPAALAGVATGGMGTAAQIAARIATFAGTTAGNDAFSAYQKIKNADPAQLAALNPEFAANPTPDAQDRIARAAALRQGLISAGINGLLTEIGPTGKLLRASTADAAEGIAKVGLAGVEAGGLTDAAKISAANPYMFAGKKIGGDVGLFVGQAVGNQVNNNITDMQVNPNATLGSGVAAAIGGAIPAAIGLGALGARSDRANARSVKEIADENLSKVQDLMASRGLSVEDAVKQHLDSLDADAIQGKTAALDLGQRKDFLDYVNDALLKDDGEGIQSRKENLSNDLIDQAKKRVEDGLSPDVDSALNSIESSNEDGLHQDIFDMAKTKVSAAQEDIDSKAKAAEELEKVKAAQKEQDDLDAGQVLNDQFKKSGESSVDDFAEKSNLSDEQKQQLQKYLDMRDDQIAQAVEKLKARYEKSNRFSEEDNAAKLDKLESRLKSAYADSGIEKSKHFDRMDVIDAAMEEMAPKLRSDYEQKAKAHADEIHSLLGQAKSLDEFDRIYRREKAAKNEFVDQRSLDNIRSSLAEKAKKESEAKNIDAMKARSDLSIKKIEAQGNVKLAAEKIKAESRAASEKLKSEFQNKKLALQESIAKEKNALARAKLEKSLKEAEAKHIMDLEKIEKQAEYEIKLREAKVEAKKSESQIRLEEAKAKHELESKLEEQKAANKLRQAKLEAGLKDGKTAAQSMAEHLKAKDPARVDSAIKLLHSLKEKLQSEGKLSEVKYDSGSLRAKELIKEDLNKIFPSDEPGSTKAAEKNGVHYLLAKEWEKLNPLPAGKAGRPSKDKHAEVSVSDISTPGRVKARLSPDESSREVSGNIFAGKDISEKEVMDFLSKIKDFNVKSLAKFIKISKNVDEAFSHNQDLLKSIKEDLNGHKPNGLFDPETGTIHIFTDNIKDEADAKRTILHEVFHRGFKAFVSDHDVEQAQKLAQKMLNSNSYLRKLADELKEKGILKGNDEPLHKLDETLAYMAEDLTKTKSEMSRGVVRKVIQALRDFAHSIIEKIAGKEMADEFLPSMSDREIIDAIRSISSKGFEEFSNMMGPRATVMIDGKPVTRFTFRIGSDEMAKISDSLALASKEDTFNGHIASATRILINSFRGIVDQSFHGEMNGLGSSLMTFRSKAHNDAMLSKLEGYLNANSRIAHSMQQDAIEKLGYNNAKSYIDGNLSNTIKDLVSTFKWMKDTTQDKVDRFINTYMIDTDKDGRRKLYNNAEIEKVFAENGAKAGLAKSDVERVKSTYNNLISGAKTSRENKAKAFIRNQAMNIHLKAAGDPELLARLQEARLDPESLRNLSVEEVNEAFKKTADIFKAFKGKKGELSIKRIEDAVKTELSIIDAVRNSAYIPVDRDGKFFVSAVEKFNEDGVEKERTLHRAQTNSRGEAISILEDVRKGLHISDEAERARFLKGVASGSIEIRSGDTPESSVREGKQKEIQDEIASVEADKSLSSIEKKQKIQSLYDKFVDESLRLASEDHAAENNSSKLITGFNQDAKIGVLRAIERQSRQAAKMANAYELTTWMHDVSKGDLKDRGYLRTEGRKAIERVSMPDNRTVQQLRGAGYFAYMAGSAASAIIQHFQQYALTAPVMSQFKKGSGLRMQKAIAQASFDVAFGRMSKAEKAFIEEAAKNGYLQHPEYVRMAQTISNSLGHRFKPLGAIGRAANSFMGTVEANNRAATWLAVYREFGDGKGGLAQKMTHGSKEFTTLSDFANHVTQEAHFNMEKYNRSDVESTPLGQLVMQFKMFPIHMLQTASRLPMKQKGEMMLALLALSGVNGLPFASDIENMIDTVSEWMGRPFQSKQWASNVAKDVFGEDVGYAVMNGSGSLAGVDFGKRIGAGDIVPFIASLRPSNQHAQDDFFNDLGASLGYMNDIRQSIADIASGDTRKALIKIAPTAAANIYKGAEILATGQEKNDKGEIVREASPFEGAAKMLGFKSTESAKYSEAKEFDSRDKEEESFVSKTLAKEYAKAQFSGDQQAMAEVMQKASDWNKEHMGTPLMIRTDAFRNAVKDYQQGHNGTLTEIDRKIAHSSGPEKIYWVNYKNAIQGLGEKQ